jgi:hypothetical protein
MQFFRLFDILNPVAPLLTVRPRFTPPGDPSRAPLPLSRLRKHPHKHR